MLEQTCCFTGHRPQSLPWGFRENDPCCLQLKARLRQEVIRMIQKQDVRHFLSGMALGVDTWAAEIVLALKEKDGLPLTLECAIPWEGQANRWREADRNRYFSILARCDKETLLQTQYTPGCLQRRNQYMVDHSRYLLAVWNGSPSGTGVTLLYARETGRQVFVIPPLA